MLLRGSILTYYRVITRLRNELFSKIIRQDISFHDQNRSGELISRLGTDTVVVGRTLTNNIADGMRSLVMAMTGVGAMLYVNVDLTVISYLILGNDYGDSSSSICCCCFVWSLR